ncbi:GGDEF domain-containing protein [Colwellia sp. MB02u-18]|uniref:GGDEF domain-containing protein n=1 Tax=unclassified Colwellia TaxID=196834 RepID=UPI0015F58013|nr:MULTISPECIES: GGDEF domain-containing protein [unclassified Colwellia]MBA6225913.1 GGDEF domain-containing protein [Colwellia sp. MB3u-45]MBA6267149.1 GGDEF domain-containing protein [Colwellia sp. MB3u-43]MBA6322073.1 GGDEF domain-containing protein [Colwellia sp. MB02u-19]MBA6325303.1 GGDEF domain-containing protein [Colwellia sp. MB02u-18]MBA6330322.1 GGDEF domain-containing protein [Colwellia sp. MB02u-12]
MYQSSTIINHIANFTSQRNTELLAFSLLKSVNSMISCLSTRIITVNKKGDIRAHIFFENSHYTVNDSSIEVESALRRSFEHMHDSSLATLTVKTKTGYSVIHLLHHDRKSEQFLIINLEEKMAKESDYILSGLLSIYSNFIKLLNESQTDELTGLANRKTFDSAISNIFNTRPQEYKKVERDRRIQESHKYWLVMVDIDDFKHVNDRFGHLYGDEILIHLAQIIRSNFRNEDLQFRFGGEEFVILLSADNQMECMQILERFRRNVEEYQFPNLDTVTVSIGVVELKKETFHITSIDYADQALYKSKKSGKNQITFFENMLSQGIAKKSDIQGGSVDFF